MTFAWRDGARRPRLAAAVVALAVAGGAAQEPLRQAYAAAEGLRLGGAPPEEIGRAYGRALDLFLRLAPDDPSHAEWLPVAAFCAYQARDWSRAIELYQAALRRGGDDATNAGQLLRALVQGGRGAEALHTARALAERFAEPVRTVLVAEGGLERARALDVADAWLRDGDTAAGLWVFRYAVAARGGQALDLANLALALRRVGLEAECDAVYRRALELAPDDALIWNDYALFLRGAGRRDEAERAFRESRAREQPADPGPATANLALMGLGGRELLDQPRLALARVLAQRPSSPMSRRALLDLLAAAAAEDERAPGSARRGQ